MKLKALAIVGMAVLGVTSLSQGALAGGTCPDGTNRGTYTNSLAECSLPEETDIQKNNGDMSLMDVVVQAINVVVGIVGVAAVAVIVVGGIFYVTSTGDAAKTKRAMSTILYGVVGLVVATVAFAIVNFVLKAVFTKSSSSSSADTDADAEEKNGALVIDYDDIG